MTVVAEISAGHPADVSDIDRPVLSQSPDGEYGQLWDLPSDTPEYLLPGETMRAGVEIADPALRTLIERAWDVTVSLHLTERANSHPHNREDDRDRMGDTLDAASLRVARLAAVGRFVLPDGVPVALTGLPPHRQTQFLQGVGQCVLEAAYGEGCDIIERFERRWYERDWEGLVGLGWLTAAQAEELGRVPGEPGRHVPESPWEEKKLEEVDGVVLRVVVESAPHTRKVKAADGADAYLGNAV